MSHLPKFLVSIVILDLVYLLYIGIVILLLYGYPPSIKSNINDVDQ